MMVFPSFLSTSTAEASCCQVHCQDNPAQCLILVTFYQVLPIMGTYKMSNNWDALCRAKYSDTDSKAEAPDTAHSSREHAERTDTQMISVLHTPLPSMKAEECPGCVGYSHTMRYFGAQQS